MRLGSSPCSADQAQRRLLGCNRSRRDDGRYLREKLPTESLALRRESSALVVSQAQALAAELFVKERFSGCGSAVEFSDPTNGSAALGVINRLPSP